MNQAPSFDATKLKYGSALYLLKLLYDKAVQMTDALFPEQSLVNVESKNLNALYTPTFLLIGKLLERDDFKELQDGADYLFSTLIARDEIDWEHDRISAYDYIARVEYAWIDAGSPTVTISNELQQVFNDIDSAIEETQRYVAKANETTIVTLDEIDQKGKPKPFTKDPTLYMPDVKIDGEVKGLTVYSDGNIRINGEALEMRGQLKELLREFVLHPQRLVNVDDIKDKIIHADKRENTSADTIAKYVSELRRILRPHFKKDVFSNDKKTGWRFNP